MVLIIIHQLSRSSRFPTSEKIFSEYHLEIKSLSDSFAANKFMDRDNIDWSLPTVKIGWFFFNG